MVNSYKNLRAVIYGGSSHTLYSGGHRVKERSVRFGMRRSGLFFILRKHKQGNKSKSNVNNTFTLRELKIEKSM